MTSAPVALEYHSPPPLGRPPRRSRRPAFTAWWALYLLTIRQYMHGRKWMVLAVLFVLPAALAVFVRSTAPNVPLTWLEFSFAYMFIPQALLPLVALIYASGMIQDEQEEQTLTYLLIRPIPKWAMYCVKLLATLTTTVLLTALFTAVTYVAIYARSGTTGVPERCLKTIAIHSLAVTAYCALFGLIGLLTKRTLIVGILYAAIFEGLLANLPFSIRLITVIYYSRVIAYRTLSFVAPEGNGTTDVAAPVWRFDVANDPTLLEHPQVRTCVLILLGASAILTLVAAYLCARTELHVKTPEKP
jgi:ABC-2 type transport system permease protein